MINDENTRVDLISLKPWISKTHTQVSIIDLNRNIFSINSHLNDISILYTSIVLKLNPLIVFRLESFTILQSEPPFILWIQLFKTNPTIESRAHSSESKHINTSWFNLPHCICKSSIRKELSSSSNCIVFC